MERVSSVSVFGLMVSMIVLLGCGASQQTDLEGPAVEADLFEGDPWPEIRARRIAELLPIAMERSGVDTWLTVCRENNNDPMAPHIGCENAGGTAVFLFFRQGDGESRTIVSIGVSPQGEATALAEKEMLDEVLVIERGTSPLGAGQRAARALRTFCCRDQQRWRTDH